MKIIEVEIIQWDKHQPRKDIKHPTWFALSNHIMDDSKLFDLTDSEWKAMLYLFCQASQQNSSKVTVNLSHAKRVCEISEKTMLSAIDKLAYAGVTCAYGSRTAAYRDTHTDRHTHTQTDTSDPSDPVRACFDFESIYKKYPKKVGKEKGLKLCKAKIKTQQDFELLEKAVDRYVAQLRKDGTLPQFIKHFPSFVACWRDYLDESFGEVEEFGKETKFVAGGPMDSFCGWADV